MTAHPARPFGLTLGICLLISACGRPEAVTPPPSAGGQGGPAGPLRDEIPPAQLSAVIDATYRGLGAMERYEYPEAAEAFRDAHGRAPGWVAGSINLAVALLNQGGEEAEKSQKGGQAELEGVPKRNIDEARRLLDAILANDPKNPHALFSRGIILRFEGRMPEAHRDFTAVTEIDPGDANAWLERGMSLTDPETDGMPAERKQAKELIHAYTKALECNPNLVTAMFRLQAIYQLAGDFENRRKFLSTFEKLDPRRNPTGAGEVAALVYGEMGKYARVIDPFPRPKPPAKAAAGPRFGPANEIDIKLPEGSRWSSAADFTDRLAPVGRARVRFGAGVATFDADGDNRADVYLTAAVVGPKGVRDALLLNKGDGKFEDVTIAWGLPEDRAGLGVAAGDFDADRRLDLFLTGVGDNRLYRNVGGRFEDVTEKAGIEGRSAISPTARWMDLDQDGDLDLYVVNYAPASEASRAFEPGPRPPGLANSAYRNDGRPAAIAHRPEDNWVPLAVATKDLPATSGLTIAFVTTFPGKEALGGGGGNHTAVAALDIDEDRDIDLVSSAVGEAPSMILNDRGGAYHSSPMSGPAPMDFESSLLVTDSDGDGRPDLVIVGTGQRVIFWRNATTRDAGAVKIAWTKDPTPAVDWRAATAADLDLDTLPDLVGLPSPDPMHALGWARTAGGRTEAGSLALGPIGDAPRSLTGFALADLAGDPLPDVLLVRDGEAPRLARNLGNGQHWLAVDLAGRWKTSFDHMRTNSEGLGARLSLEGQGLHVPYDHTTPQAGLGQSVGPVVLGMGPNTSAPLLRVRWPDGVMQCELNITADKLLPLAEQSRKTGSCPVLFTWNGAKFECLGDFLGGGGMGYLVAPGVYGQPDRDESVAIAPGQLKAVDGAYRMSVVEPMDEVAYLDKLTLDVIDRPPGVSTVLDERFAPEGPRPTGEVMAYSKSIEPARATDHAGRDVTREIRDWDRRTVDQFRLLTGWIGYTEPHSLILDFEGRLAGFGPGDRLVLALAGWVEYPYSQTNYAASTAGVALKPPVLERRRDDGSWEVIDPHPGYPAGLPRMMSLDLTGKVGGPRCVLRLTTNMECYWDQAFVAVPDRSSPIRTTSLPVARARLSDRGYLREVSPDGRLPLVYEYDHVDPAPLARMEGMLTRHGDVASLLTGDDDRVCTVGPGDEVRIEFDARGLPDLPGGWTRSFVLRSIGYCKDADPFTAGSDAVGPLPWRGMPSFPFGKEGERPIDPGYAAYLREYQTRPAGVR